MAPLRCNSTVKLDPLVTWCSDSEGPRGWKGCMHGPAPLWALLPCAVRGPVSASRQEPFFAWVAAPAAWRYEYFGRVMHACFISSTVHSFISGSFLCCKSATLLPSGSSATRRRPKCRVTSEILGHSIDTDRALPLMVQEQLERST